MRFIYIFILFTILSSQFTPAQNGVIKSYYPDGTVQSETSYVNDVLDGAVITYYPNGKISSEKNYSQGILDGYVRDYYESGLLKEEYFVKSGIKDGAHRRYTVSGELISLLSYSEGELIKSELFGSGEETPAAAVNESKNNSGIVKIEPKEVKGEPVKERNALTADEKPLKKAEPEQLPKVKSGNEAAVSIVKDEEILCDVQECPEPIGGFKAIYDNLLYPEHALRYGLQGTVTIIATINPDGNVTRTQVLKGLGYGCDEAAQEALRKTRFTPGRQHGVPAETNATINLAFIIAGKMPDSPIK
jgi:TonB family protein